MCYSSRILYFFYQAEDGIRDHCVTGVQTCALPISVLRLANREPIHLLLYRARIGKASDIRKPRTVLAVPKEASFHFEDRKSVVWGKSVDLGGHGSSNKKT